MEKATRSAIERSTQRARKILEEDYAAQLEGVFDILPSGSIAPEAGSHLTARETFERERIVAAIHHSIAAGATAKDAVAAFLRDAAFTTFNRFVALKMLEARDLLQECISQGEDSAGYREFCGMAPGVALLPDAAGYRLYVECLFDELTSEVKVLFDRRDVASVLWPNRLTLESLLTTLNGTELMNAWSDDETIGWVYQYFNSGEERKKMREASQAPRNSHELAVRNQFFTPRYVVEFLVDNTLGRTWFEMSTGASSVVDGCDYFVEPIEKADVKRPKKDPRDFRILDPACGSGHFLLYCFDLLVGIYEEAWAAGSDWAKSDATGRSLRDDFSDLESLRVAVPGLILENNLYGIDIDPRCAQIAALALWLRVQTAFRELGVARDARPPVTRTHIVVAEPMPGDAALIDEFAERLSPPLLGDLLRKMIESMQLAGEMGALLRVESSVSGELKRAREQFVTQRRTPPTFPGLEPEEAQGELDLSGVGDDQFFVEADSLITDALQKYSEIASGGANVRRRLFAGDATEGLALIEMVRTRFDVVLMNPPFGAGSLVAKKELDRSYPLTKNDLFAAFVERGVEMLNPYGYLGAITSRTGFFLSSFQRWREEIVLTEAPPVVFADLGYGVLDATVEVAAYVLKRESGAYR